ncbi:hypothetical protein R2601_04078 [Salipiger bermudensis HTCC2601]|uniref:Uncharacterized protein n=1 Tax=Salipiger bermudensis (strain DSM 26914 / JCM 13377 / KCTC 12554 / HTCC2601) TaxID=314265 RepID=Q0FW30_SALBH|nr:hypothetical protein R2601_04078 [Salipiger bermudensis HTCC2601]
MRPKIFRAKNLRPSCRASGFAGERIRLRPGDIRQRAPDREQRGARHRYSRRHERDLQAEMLGHDAPAPAPERQPEIGEGEVHRHHPPHQPARRRELQCRVQQRQVDQPAGAADECRREPDNRGMGQCQHQDGGGAERGHAGDDALDAEGAAQPRQQQAARDRSDADAAIEQPVDVGLAGELVAGHQRQKRDHAVGAEAEQEHPLHDRMHVPRFDDEPDPL